MPAQASLQTTENSQWLPVMSILEVQLWMVQKHATDLQDLCPHHPTQECHQAFPHQSLPTSNMHGLLAIGEIRGKHIQLHLDRPRIKGQRLAL